MVSFDGLGDLGILRFGRRPGSRGPRRTVPRLRSLRAGGALVLLAVATAACGGASGTADAPSPAPLETPPAGANEPTNGATAEGIDGFGYTNPHIDADICALIPLEDVIAAAGAVGPGETEASNSVPTSCRYLFRLPETPSQPQASASIQMLDDFELERLGAGDRAEDVAGLGESAWALPFTDSYVLHVQRGDLVFSVNVASTGDDAQEPVIARAIAELVLALL